MQEFLTPVKIIKVTPVITPGVAYTVGDQVGAGLITLDVGASKNPVGLIAVDYIDQIKAGSMNLHFLFFRDTFTITTADNDAFAPSDADMAAYFAQGFAASSPTTTLGSNQVYYTGLSPRPMQSNREDGKLYLMPIANGAFTLTGASDLVIKLGFQLFSKIGP